MARIFSSGFELTAMSPDETSPPSPQPPTITVADLVASLQMCDQSSPVYLQGEGGPARSLRLRLIQQPGQVLIEWDTTYSPE